MKGCKERNVAKKIELTIYKASNNKLLSPVSNKLNIEV